jgi:hypothetical protein
MREAVGKLTFGPRSRTGVLYIPSNLMVDSTFPFKAPVNLRIRIDGECLIVERVE